MTVSCVYRNRWLPLVTPHLFSSVFRVASAGNVWVFTHYDVCDNILIGVRGRKRVVLFAPRDVDRLYVDGSTSRIVDIDSAAQSTTQFPRFRKAYERRYEAVLEQGDILYIPALWFHTTFAIGAPAVGVNMFWRDPALPREFLSTRDLYGNVDPIPAAQLLRELTIEDHGTVKPPSLNSLLRSLEQLPPHYRDFYGRKFVDEIQKRLVIELAGYGS
jgi:tRNA wybutosine-synthesizing protein 5